MKLTASNAKAVLELAGLFPKFSARRDELKKSGSKLKEAVAQALSEFEVQIPAEVWAQLEPTGPGEVQPTCPVGEPRPAASVFGEIRTPKDIKTRDEYERFMSRTADMVKQVSWVAKHMDVSEDLIRFEDIPCAEAWGMLQSYKTSVERRQEFWDKVYPKLMPSRSQLDETNKQKREVDGADILRAIDNLESIRAKFSKRRKGS